MAASVCKTCRTFQEAGGKDDYDLVYCEHRGRMVYGYETGCMEWRQPLKIGGADTAGVEA